MFKSCIINKRVLVLSINFNLERLLISKRNRLKKRFKKNKTKLYHGTCGSNVQGIFDHGLLSKARKTKYKNFVNSLDGSYFTENKLDVYKIANYITHKKRENTMAILSVDLLMLDLNNLFLDPEAGIKGYDWIYYYDIPTEYIKCFNIVQTKNKIY